MPDLIDRNKLHYDIYHDHKGDLSDTETVAEILLRLETADVIEKSESVQWISIDEKLPEVGQDVLIHYVSKSDPSDDGITITKLMGYIWFGHAVPTEPYWKEEPYWKDPWQYFHSDYDITHWMYLPTAPEVMGKNE